jgi:phosphoenolpyruvate synthase/pyruvate phosphate dikinase
MLCDKDSGTSIMLAFANFSEAIWPDQAGGLIRKTVDYSQLDLSRDAATRKLLGRRLAAISRFVEEALQTPQDIEGVLVEDEIYLVQARPQRGLSVAMTNDQARMTKK